MPKSRQRKPTLQGTPYEFPVATGFPDPHRREKLAVAFPTVRNLFQNYMTEQHIPGLAFGIVLDGELVFADALGVREVEANAPATVDTVFRIASMSKSFIAMSILRLRDDNKLRLDDPVAKYIPELKNLRYPTDDSPPLTLRHLLTMSPGFPEDNPWGDRQMAIDERTFTRWLRAGIPFSNAPDITYEYSNYAYAILGRVLSRLSGIRFQQYVDKAILKPLGMHATTWDKRRVPLEHFAYGYRWEDEQFKHEPILTDGAFAAMAGLFTTVPDFARYMAFLLDAFPPRNDPELGPVKRATAREMQQLRRYEELVERKLQDGPTWRAVSGYGFGLAVWHDERLGYGVAHGGGLPGFGSYFYLLPHHGVGIVALSNKTYARVGLLFPLVLDALARTGGLVPRATAPARVLVEMREVVQRWLDGGSDAELAAHAADNFLLDRDLSHRRADLEEMRADVGATVRASELIALNALRGKWRVECQHGWIEVFLTLAPTLPPRIQMLTLTADKAKELEG